MKRQLTQKDLDGLVRLFVLQTCGPEPVYHLGFIGPTGRSALGIAIEACDGVNILPTLSLAREIYKAEGRYPDVVQLRRVARAWRLHGLGQAMDALRAGEPLGD